MTTRKRKIAVTEETRTTTRHRRKITVTETATTDQFPAIAWAPGWGPADIRLTGAALRVQRAEQVNAAVQFLYIRAADLDTAETLRCASNILRAGPGSSLAERVHGRIT